MMCSLTLGARSKVQQTFFTVQNTMRKSAKCLKYKNYYVHVHVSPFLAFDDQGFYHMQMQVLTCSNKQCRMSGTLWLSGETLLIR